MGYRFQFITLAGFHALNASMFELAKGFAGEGMTAYVRLQERSSVSSPPATPRSAPTRGRHGMVRSRVEDDQPRRIVDARPGGLHRIRPVLTAYPERMLGKLHGAIAAAVTPLRDRRCVVG